MQLRLYFIFGFCLTCLLVDAQSTTGILKGKVLDSRTLRPIPYTSVFFNNTTIGMYTNDKGEFELSRIPFGDYDFIVSSMGYQTYQTKIKVQDDREITLVVKLIENVLKAVEIKSTKDVQWAKQYEKFKKLFFGNSVYTSSCKIYNPWVLDFDEDKEGDFKATALAPLKVENLGLGYLINYQLKEFSAGRTGFNIKGNVRFEELLTPDTATISKWKKRRDDAYEGSYRHLFKSMIDDKVEAEGFRLYEDRSNQRDVIRLPNFLSNLNTSVFPFSMENKVINGNIPGQFSIQLPSRLEVHYLNKSASPSVYTNVTKPISWIEVKDGYLLVNENGVLLNPGNMVAMGVMSEARIAEILPENFVPNEKKVERVVIKPRKISSLSFLIEKPYLHTDRSYYYPHEIIWFEGYMNYFSPGMKDSLSHVLYVDLVNDKNRVVETKTFPIVDGRIKGNFPLPRGLYKGDFLLRAYTRWVLNFDPSFVYTKPIKILDYLELAKQDNAKLIDTSKTDVSIVTNKQEYQSREKITIAIDVIDFYGYSRASHLSVSVTDIQSAIPAENEKKIGTAFPILPSALPDSLTPAPKYLIQYGSELKGFFQTKKGSKKMKGLITVAQDNTDDVFNITTTEEGDFYIPNLQLYDTSKLYAQAKSVKGNRPGVVVLDSTQVVPSLTDKIELLKLDVFKSESAIKDKRIDMPLELPAHLLESVTIKSTKIEEKPRPKGSIIDADVVIDDEWLRKAENNDDLLSVLQRRVSGLRVVYQATDNGTMKYVVMGGPTALTGYQEPLVLVNGVAMDTREETAGNQLSMMNSSSVQRIEVVKFGGGAAYGARGGNGVIHIFMRTDLSSGFEPPKLDKTKMQPLKTMGYGANLKFKSPDYSQPEEGQVKGDYRITIYWNPEVITGGKVPPEVSFYAADLPTRYRIVVEGVDVTGQPLRGEKIITIR